tara:strand:- start:140 stop:952 length:813 start_codon:yes stop_codon:yes gene_type:complete
MSKSMPTELVQRVVTATFLIPIVLYAVFLGGWVFSAMVVIAVILMANEWEQVTGGERFGHHALLNMFAGIMALSLGSIVSVEYVLAFIVAISLLSGCFPRRDGSYSIWPCIGVILIIVPALCLVWLRALNTGMLIILWLFLVLWATDSGAYFVGRTFGKKRLVPRISPGKTWAGLYGGTAAGAIIGVSIAAIVHDFSMLRAVLLSILISLVGQGGDLAISAVKRHFDVKDMGTMIPGHGGVLDRLDSLLFGAMVIGIITFAYGGSMPLWP